MTTPEEQPCCCQNAKPEPCCCDTSAHVEPESCCCDESAAATAQEAAAAEQCCCSTSSSCCSDSAYSCEDDAYAGEMQEVVVDFLFLDLDCCDRCQGADERVASAVERCHDVLAACGFSLTLNQLYMESPELAERYRFESSPTIRVNGVDICPSIEENDCACCSDISGTDVTCRVFPFNGTYYEVPPTDLIVRGIMEVALQGQKPPCCQPPYVMPENLRAFYEGKALIEAAQETR